MWVIIRGLTWFWHAGMVNILFLSAKYFYLRWIVEFLIVEFAYANAFVLLVLLIKHGFLLSWYFQLAGYFISIWYTLPVTIWMWLLDY